MTAQPHQSTTGQPVGDPERPRPRVHFTAEEGWVNDPYGISWVDGAYQLYYQAIPAQVTWAPNCHWGHATSPDLIHWQEQPLALTPQDFEVGCWSGSVVESDPATIYYTRVAGDEWEIGQVATARRDSLTGQWHSTADSIAIDAPPTSLRLRAFRDPFVFRRGDGWGMLIGAAFQEGSGGVLQYISADQQQWTYDGVLCSRPADPGDEVFTGALWECPQLFQLDGRWVLMISVWDAQDLLYVAASVGTYDGHTFAAGRWQRLTYGNSAYAAAAFVDRDGRRCLLAWLREEPRNNPQLAVRAGAHSLPLVIGLTPQGWLHLRPHPNLDHMRGAVVNGLDGDHRVDHRVGAGPVDAAWVAADGRWVTIAEPGLLRARIVATGTVLRLSRPGMPSQEMPLPVGDARVRILLDADIVEIFTAEVYGAFRIRPANEPAQTILTSDVDSVLVARPLTGECPHGVDGATTEQSRFAG